MDCKYKLCKFVAEVGKEYCAGHLPVGDDKKPHTQAFQVIVDNQLKEHNYDFEGWIFPGIITFKRKTFQVGQSLRKAVFHGSVSFEGCTFAEDADFFNTHFLGSVSFKSATFENSADFRTAVFGDPEKDRATQEPVNFKMSKFLGGADFSGSHFHSIAEFAKGQFQGIVKFNLVQFLAGVYFQRSKFLESVNFSSAQFIGVHASGASPMCADFSDVKFKGGVSFLLSIFEHGLADFTRTEFVGEEVDFTRARFLNDQTDFSYAHFKCENLSFMSTQFEGFSLGFLGCHFDVKSLLFDHVMFFSTNGRFSNCKFEGDVEFSDCTIGGTLDLVKLRLEPGAPFRVVEPRFRPGDVPPRMYFEDIQFEPFLTSFEYINLGAYFPVDKPAQTCGLFFKSCRLKEVRFTECNMKLISFFGCAFFEEILTVSCEWAKQKERVFSWLRPKYCRQNILLDELLFNEKVETIKYREKGNRGRDRLKELTKRRQLADMYQWLKTSADRAKDYHLAGWFYFNEIEMKRLALIDDLQHESPKDDSGEKPTKFERGMIRFRFWMYCTYKLFAGYGEKPGWSFGWFVIFTLLFSVLHLWNGLEITKETLENCSHYDRVLSFSPNFWTDFGLSLRYTLSRVIPISYLPGLELEVIPATDNIRSFLLDLTNSVVLVLLLVFTAIGLKRHFRRF